MFLSLGRSVLVLADTAPQPHSCPDASELVRDGFWWTARNGTWKNFNQSFSQKITSFIGAQWNGVKVGKITCLYSPEGGDNFPVALEEVKTEIALEPKSSNWSALIGSRKLCKSANVADCSYYIEEQLTSGDVYKGIGYGDVKQNGNNENDGDYAY